MRKEPGVCVNHLVVKIKDYVIEEYRQIEQVDQSIIEAKYQHYLDKLEDIERFQRDPVPRTLDSSTISHDFLNQKNDSLIIEDLDMVQPLDTSNAKKQKEIVQKWFNETYIQHMETHIKYQMVKH